MAIPDSAISNRVKFAGLLLVAAMLSGCNTTSGSDRLDTTGERIAEATTDSQEPETSAFYIQALKGGLISKITSVKLSASDRARGLEAEYKALETSPGGQSVVWEGSGGLKGEVVAAVPYQVGSQNCRQYTHSLRIKEGAEPQIARGAACRNSNGSWTPLL